METFSLNLPSMFGDHHVLEVRRILSGLSGIAAVYASSSFRLVELEYDPALITPDRIRAALQEAGYLEALAVPIEIGAAVEPDSERPFFRQTAAFPNIQKTVSFTQEIPAAVRPLWPCPGLTHKQAQKEVEHG